MSKKIETLKKIRRTLVAGLCVPIVLSGCGSNESKKSDSPYKGYYVVVLHNDKAIIYETKKIYTGVESTRRITMEIQDEEKMIIGEPFFIIDNDDENSKEEAYNIANYLVGAEGEVIFYQDTILKKKKTP